MLLKRGDNNENVKKLQKKLGIDPVGNFGPKTEEAVKAFQLKNGLKPDGIVGDKTWNAIMQIVSETHQPSDAIPTPQPPKPTSQTVIQNTGGLRLERLKGHIPDAVIAQIPETAKKFKIDTPLRLAHFLSQCGHESINFTAVKENLNYGAKGLLNIFGRYFPNEALAKQYERQPEKIANRVYGGRMGNGPESSGEGFKYRGRGYIQLTGKDNYRAFGAAIGVDIVNNPDLVATTYPLLSAAWFFQRCLPKCDMGSNEEAVKAVTRCVNGGQIGLADRLKHFKEYYSLLTT